MPSIHLGQLLLEFEQALIHVPCSRPVRISSMLAPIGLDWADFPQRIAIQQHRDHAVVRGLDGYGVQRGRHRVEVVAPLLNNAQAVVEYLVTQAASSETEHEVVRQVVETAQFPCGQVFSLNWSALGYAPGGRQYCLLPPDLPAISTGFLRLDWSRVRVCRAV